MYQLDKSTYQKDSTAKLFFRSGFGKFCIVAMLIAVVVLIASMTVPSDSYMEEETMDAIRQCLEDKQTHQPDKVDEAVRNMLAIFTDADTAKTSEQMRDFYHYNRLAVYPHSLYSTARIHNNLHAEGVRVAIGIFGVVIPTVSINDMILRSAPVRGEYNKKIIKEVIGDDEEYYGDNPDLKHRYGPYKKFDNYN